MLLKTMLTLTAAVVGTVQAAAVSGQTLQPVPTEESGDQENGMDTSTTTSQSGPPKVQSKLLSHGRGYYPMCLTLENSPYDSDPMYLYVTCINCECDSEGRLDNCWWQPTIQPNMPRVNNSGMCITWGNCFCMFMDDKEPNRYDSCYRRMAMPVSSHITGTTIGKSRNGFMYDRSCIYGIEYEILGKNPIDH